MQSQTASQVKNVRLGVASIDTRRPGRIITFSQGFASLTGISPGQEQVDYLPLVAGEDRARVERWFAGVAQGKSDACYHSLCVPGQPPRPALLHVSRHTLAEAHTAYIALLDMAGLDAPARLSRHLLDTLPCGVVEYTIQRGVDGLRFAYRAANTTFFSLCRIQEERYVTELGGQPQRLFAAGEWQTVLQAVEEAYAHPGHMVDVECTLGEEGDGIALLCSLQCETADAGETTLVCTCQDIRSLKEARDALVLQTERLNLISAAINEYLFDYDYQADTMVITRVLGDKAERQTIAPLGEALRENVHEEDVDALLALLQGADTAENGAIDARIGLFDGEQRWRRVQFTHLYGEKGSISRAVGRVLDIHEQKLREEALRERAERDALTNLYNRGTGKMLIDDYLTQENLADSRRQHVLLMIDLDDFKQVNDQISHAYGDTVLSTIADTLQDEFRAEDIVARLGGDEFVVLVKQVESLASVDDLCQRLGERVVRRCEALRCGITLSISIGLALYPQHGRSFDTLYHAADIANYHAKAQGKNRHFLYAGDNAIHYRNQRQAQEVIQPAARVDDLESTVLHMLHEGEDRSSTLSDVLGVLARHFGLQRAYITRYLPDQRMQPSLNRWYDEGYTYDDETMRGIDKAVLDAYYHACGKQGQWVHKTLDGIDPRIGERLKTQGVSGFVQYKYMERGRLQGIIGFDYCKEGPLPLGDEQIEVLLRLSRIVAVYALQEASVSQSASMLTVTEMIDHLPTYACIIDRKTHELLYVNRAFTHTWPNVAAHETCYRLVFGRATPCPDCPMDGLDSQSPADRQVGSRRVPGRDLQLQMDASWLKGQHENQICLMNAIDVSEYVV